MGEETIFHQALRKPIGERAAFLEQVCADDLALRRRVEALLLAHDNPDSRLEPPVPGLAPTICEPVAVAPPGTVIGPYKLLEQIGEGGFGIVYMADQRAPVRRRVALKIIKPGMDTREVLARFKAELQALSLMDHPNIARALDAGATDSGRPYFVMELVRGVPITDYCDQNNLPVHARLDLFVQVCHAVQHAHQKGIIHRDIKPSNVLVTLHDGRPVPKVIDFGVAKAIDRQLTPETLFTRFAEMIGTPLYMSPEQAEMTGLDIDTRADIYSLGVLLYELLTGSTPFDKDRLRKAAFDEIRRIIREEEPPKPSLRISTSGDTRTAVAAHRHADPHRLSQLVRGDLDWIVMKALEKDRTRRYDTASNFAADVLCYLSDRPVEACPPSSVYRFRKFARRNRVAITTVAVVLIALLLGTVVSVTQAIRAKRAEQLAEDRLQEETEAHRQAEASFQRARAAVDEFFTVVSQSKLLDVPGLQPLRNDLLEAAVRYYRALAEGRDDDPSVRAGLAVAHFRLSEVYYEVGRPNDAIAAANAGLDLVERLLQEYPGRSELFRKLGGFWKGTRRTSQQAPAPDDLAAAERTLNNFIHIWEKLVAEDPDEPAFQSDLATVYDRSGQLLDISQRHGEAVARHQKAVGLWEGLVRAYPIEPEYQAALGQEYDQMADRARSAGKPSEEVKWRDKALALREKLAASYPNVPQYREDLAGSITTKAAQLVREGKTKEAEAINRRALGSWQKLAAEYPHAHIFRAQLARTYSQLKQWDNAIADWSKVIELEPKNVSLLDSRAKVYGQLKQWDKALADWSKAIELDPTKWSLLGSRADVYSELKQWDKAVADYSKAIELDPKAGWPLVNRANAYRQLKQWDKAIADYSKAIELDPKNTWLLGNRANVYGQLNQWDKAIADWSKSVELDPKNGSLLVNRAEAFRKLKQWDKTIADYSKAIELDLKNTWPLGNRANVYRQLKQWDKALADYSKVIELEPKNVWALGSRAYVYSQLRQWDKAIGDYTTIVELEPKNAQANNSLAWFLATSAEARLQHPIRAVELAKRAVELAPKEGTLWNTFGVAHYRAGDWKAATAALKKSDELLKGNELSFNAFFLAMAHWQLGNKDEARKWYDQAVGWMEKNKPQDEELHRFRAETEELLGSNKTSKPSVSKTPQKEDKPAK